MIAPHDRQKRAPGVTTWAQFGQRLESGKTLPQDRQKRAVSWLAAPQELQRNRDPAPSCATAATPLAVHDGVDAAALLYLHLPIGAPINGPQN
jgi:hypothetical protein